MRTRTSLGRVLGRWAPLKRWVGLPRWAGRAILGVAVTSLLALPAYGQASGDDWRRGVSLFEQGKYKEALEHLDKFIASDPSNEDALRARNEAGYQVMAQMLQRKDEIATVARKLLDLATKGERFKVPGRDRIVKLIRRMNKGAYEDRYLAMNELVSQIGPFCVPYLVEQLADRHDDDRRSTAIVALSRLGPDGTNAVIELLYHPDDFVRENTCHILGHVRDVKALPYLRAIAERREESTQVTKAAREALQNITGKDADRLPSALELFAALADRYVHEHRTVTINNFRRWSLWNWSKDKLAFRLVPGYAWNDEMAENVCYDALDHARRIDASQADLDAIYTLLVTAHFEEVVEVDHLIRVADAKKETGGIDETDYAELTERRSRVGTLEGISAAAGETQVCKALRKALRDRNVPLAVALIEELRDMRLNPALLPAEGTDLVAYLKEGKAPAGLKIEPRRSAPSSSPARSRAATTPPTPPVRRAPAATPPAKKAPAATPPAKKEEPAPKPAPKAPRRRRRFSQSGAAPLEGLLAEAYGPTPLRTLQSGGGAHGAALAAALIYDDKRVRYAAAEALLRLAPPKKFAGSDKVWEGLAGALGESGSRVVLVAAHDQQVRNRMTGILRDLHHLPFAVRSAREAVLRARTQATQDAIIVASRFLSSDFSTAELIREIKKDYRTKGLPIIVVAPRLEVRRKKEQFPNAAAVLADDLDPVVMKDTLDALWSGEYARPNDPKRLAVEIARKAAEAIAESDPRSSIYGLERTIPALLEAVEYQPDAVRIPAFHALGVLGAREALDKAAIVFANKRNRGVRIAAAFCLGEALRDQAVPSKVLDSFQEAMATRDHDLSQACGEALGKMRLTREQSVKLLEALRVD